MRVYLTLAAAGLIALAGVLLGCNGDEEATQAEPQQSQSEPAEAGQAERDAVARQSERTQQSAAESAEGEQDDAQATADPQPQSDDPLLAEAIAALDAWTADLETMVVEVAIEFDLLGLAAQVDAVGTYRAEPFSVLTTLDASGLFGAVQALAEPDGEQPEAPVLLQVLIDDSGGFLSMPGLGGWVDLSENFDEALENITALLGSDATAIADPSGFGQTIGCVEAVGGVVTYSQHNGEDVWLVDCHIDVEQVSASVAQMLREEGIELADSGIETLHMRMAISRASGAPLLVETNATITDPLGLTASDGDDEEEVASYVNSVSTLRSWNEPVEFPTPEPLVDATELGLPTNGDAAADSGSSVGSEGAAASGELLSAEELIGRAESWLAVVDELHLQFVAQAVIDGESRLASTVLRSSRSQGAFETEVVIDGSSVFRLLWSRDGIWTSSADAAGAPVWEPSSPALLGFSSLTVDEFLANPDRVNLQEYADLLDLSWVTRTIEGGGPAVYELVIESGPRLPGDDHFEAIADLLLAETAELLAAGVTIDSIEHFSTIITIIGDDGRIESQVTTAEFESNAGRVELVASLSSIANGPIAFSSAAD